jgi:hypothetical protein
MTPTNDTGWERVSVTGWIAQVLGRGVALQVRLDDGSLAWGAVGAKTRDDSVGNQHHTWGTEWGAMHRTPEAALDVLAQIYERHDMPAVGAAVRALGDPRLTASVQGEVVR